MIAVSDSQFELRPAWHESFPETRTLPDGWDLSDLLRNGHLIDSRYAVTVTTNIGFLAVALPEHHPASFPEPRTLPRHWDLSGLLAYANG